MAGRKIHQYTLNIYPHYQPVFEYFMHRNERLYCKLNKSAKAGYILEPSHY